MKKIIPLVAVIAIAGFAWLFLSKQNTPTNTKNTEKEAPVANDALNNEKALTVVSPWEIQSEDPSKSGFLYQRLQIAETLVDADDFATLKPLLATAWQASNEGKTWTFTLRDGVTFHDGTALNAESVVSSINTAMSKPTQLEKAKVTQVTAKDANTVEFTLEEPLMSFPAYLAHSTTVILAPSSYADGEVKSVIGTGAYQVLSIEPPQKITQTKYDGYWGDKAQIKNVTYLANSRSETRTLMAQSEPNTLVYTLDAPSLERLQQDENLNVVTKPLTRTILLKMDNKNPLFNQVAVRQVLSDAIDRKGIAQTVMKSDSAAADEILPKAFADWMVSQPTATPDYTALKQKLITAGFSEEADGMLSLNGKPFKFTIRTFSDRPELPVIATALQDQWKKIGATVEVSVGNFSEIPAGHQDGTLEMALYARNYGTIPDPIGTMLGDFAPEGADWGVMNWNNDAVTKALNALKVTATTPENREQAKALKQQISQVIYDERPLIPVVYYQQSAVAHKDLKGLQLDSLERNFHLNKLTW